MTTLPGTTRKRPYRRIRRLLSRERARQAAVDIHRGLNYSAAEYVDHGIYKAKIAYDKWVAAPDANAGTRPGL